MRAPTGSIVGTVSLNSAFSRPQQHQNDHIKVQEKADSLQPNQDNKPYGSSGRSNRFNSEPQSKSNPQPSTKTNRRCSGCGNASHYASRDCFFVNTKWYNRDGGDFKTSEKGKEYYREVSKADRIRWRDVEPDTTLDKSKCSDYEYARLARSYSLTRDSQRNTENAQDSAGISSMSQGNEHGDGKTECLSTPTEGQDSEYVPSAIQRTQYRDSRRRSRSGDRDSRARGNRIPSRDRDRSHTQKVRSHDYQHIADSRGRDRSRSWDCSRDRGEDSRRRSRSGDRDSRARGNRIPSRDRDRSHTPEREEKRRREKCKLP